MPQKKNNRRKKSNTKLPIGIAAPEKTWFEWAQDGFNDLMEEFGVYQSLRKTGLMAQKPDPVIIKAALDDLKKDDPELFSSFKSEEDARNFVIAFVAKGTLNFENFHQDALHQYMSFDEKVIRLSREMHDKASTPPHILLLQKALEKINFIIQGNPLDRLLDNAMRKVVLPKNHQQNREEIIARFRADCVAAAKESSEELVINALANVREIRLSDGKNSRYVFENGENSLRIVFPFDDRDIKNTMQTVYACKSFHHIASRCIPSLSSREEDMIKQYHEKVRSAFSSGTVGGEINEMLSSFADKNAVYNPEQYEAIKKEGRDRTSRDGASNAVFRIFIDPEQKNYVRSEFIGRVSKDRAENGELKV